jgi:hypothetical protein
MVGLACRARWLSPSPSLLLFIAVIKRSPPLVFLKCIAYQTHTFASVGIFIIMACLLRGLGRISKFDDTNDIQPYATARALLDHSGAFLGALRLAICKGASTLEEKEAKCKIGHIVVFLQQRATNTPLSTCPQIQVFFQCHQQ